MENNSLSHENELLDTRCWANVIEGLKYTFKVLVREAVEDVIMEKMYNATVEEKRLSAIELCERWNISRNTLRIWELNGIIKPLPVGGKKKVYSLADIHSAEANGYVKTVRV